MLEPGRKAILILGMHRSGTSALARTVNLLGAEVPKELLAPNEFNPQGYWESARLYEAHEGLLASVGSSWHDYGHLDPDRVEIEAERHGHRQRIKDSIGQTFSDASLFVVKDPRICRFVPLILSILDELKVRPGRPPTDPQSARSRVFAWGALRPDAIEVLALVAPSRSRSGALHKGDPAICPQLRRPLARLANVPRACLRQYGPCLAALVE